MIAAASMYFAPMPARRLAFVRIYVGLYAMTYLLVRLPHNLAFARYPQAFFAPVGVASWLARPLPPLLYQGSVVLTVLLSITFLLGVWHRFLAPIFAILLLCVLTYTSSFGMIFHTDNLLVLQVAILSLAPSADALSLPARDAALPSSGSEYGWPIRLICAVTVAAYFLAGLAKLRNGSLDAFGGESLRNYVAFDNVRKAELGSTPSPIGPLLLPFSGLFSVLAWSTLALELGAPVALLDRRIGRAWAIALVAFHFGVLALMAIGFAYPLSGAAFAAFFDLERVRAQRSFPFVTRAAL